MSSSHDLRWFALAFIACAGCGSTVCDDALDKAESCGLQDVELSDSADACEEFAACQAGCINAGNCNDLVQLSQDPFAENELSVCLFECGE